MHLKIGSLSGDARGSQIACARIVEAILDEPCFFRDFLTELRQWARKDPHLESALKTELIDRLSPICGQQSQNIRVRGRVMDLMKSVSKLPKGSIPSSGAAALDEFKASSAKGSSEDSFLKMALDVRATLMKLKVATQYSYEDFWFEVVASCGAGNGVSMDHRGQDVANFPSEFSTSLTFMNDFEAILSDTFTLAMEHFSKTIDLQARLDIGGDFELLLHGKVEVALERLVDHEKLASHMGALGRYLNEGPEARPLP